MDAGEGVQEVAQGGNEGEGGVGSRQTPSRRPPGAVQTRQTGDGLRGGAAGLRVTHCRTTPENTTQIDHNRETTHSQSIILQHWIRGQTENALTTQKEQHPLH